MKTLRIYNRETLNLHSESVVFSTTGPTKINDHKSEPHKNLATPLTTQNFIETLRNLNINGYLYLSSIPFRKSKLYFCKYLSPNLFLHMNNASHLNISNTYSRPFHKAIIASQLANMVPFP